MKKRLLGSLVLGLGFCLAFGAALVTSKPASADIDACAASCGPAPCCEILWTTWCGCPWGEEAEIE